MEKSLYPFIFNDIRTLYGILIFLSCTQIFDKKSVANVQGIGSIPMVRLERKIGQIPQKVMIEVKKAIFFALDLS